MGDYLKKIDNAVAKGKDGPILKLAQSKDKAVRIAALRGLGRVGGDSGFHVLVPLLQDPDPDIRAAVAHALGDLGNTQAKAHILHYRERETDAQVREAMGQAISSLKD